MADSPSFVALRPAHRTKPTTVSTTEVEAALDAPTVKPVTSPLEMGINLGKQLWWFPWLLVGYLYWKTRNGKRRNRD
jgi:hypothetical protein